MTERGTALLERENAPVVEETLPGDAPRRDRAKRIMLAVAALSLVAATAPAIDRVVIAGWRAFISRPPGVGASENRAEPVASRPAAPAAPRKNANPPQASPPAPAAKEAHSVARRVRARRHRAAKRAHVRRTDERRRHSRSR